MRARWAHRQHLLRADAFREPAGDRLRDEQRRPGADDAVNSVAPGITNNGNEIFNVPEAIEAIEAMASLSAFGRVGDPQEVADVVAFLVSDAARAMTGSFVDATNGTLLGG